MLEKKLRRLLYERISIGKSPLHEPQRTVLAHKPHSLPVILERGLEDIHSSTNKPLSSKRLQKTLTQCLSPLHKVHYIKVLTYTTLPTTYQNPKNKT
jgi:hypothetical protein